ncbi:unnamed protein product [Vitrella brassicaformis CCMP3155]|uniref:Ion transport domain-containing protein n=2 Tax=Vitrella brassicaformis TaxID=1169539 RepID=A0A0G4GF09_VITBC|nr:unnamed protein product [Vitrella brassicaformis CCMP3155]|eukprot:CEM28094.1 unnamed protein product [Vitrella brassicaformis CCMP3155]
MPAVFMQRDQVERLRTQIERDQSVSPTSRASTETDPCSPNGKFLQTSKRWTRSRIATFLSTRELTAELQDNKWQQFLLRVEGAKKRIYLLLEVPDSSQVATVISIAIMLLIAVSVTAFMLETMPELNDVVPLRVWEAIEGTTVGLFTLEFVLRLSVVNIVPEYTLKIFLTSWMNWFDLLAFAPYYVRLMLSSFALGGFRVLRVVRLIRVFRIFKLSRYSVGLRLMGEGLKRSIQALWILVFFLAIGIILFSSAMYEAEKRVEPSQFFPSIPATFWWAVVTMCTVGYGDVYPQTGWGKVVATAAMLAGILFIALPVAIIGNKFQEVYMQMEDEMTESLSRRRTMRMPTGDSGRRNTAGSTALRYSVGAAPPSSSSRQAMLPKKERQESRDVATVMGIETGHQDSDRKDSSKKFKKSVSMKFDKERPWAPMPMTDESVSLPGVPSGMASDADETPQRTIPVTVVEEPIHGMQPPPLQALPPRPPPPPPSATRLPPADPCVRPSDTPSLEPTNLPVSLSSPHSPPLPLPQRPQAPPEPSLSVFKYHTTRTLTEMTEECPPITDDIEQGGGPRAQQPHPIPSDRSHRSHNNPQNSAPMVDMGLASDPPDVGPAVDTTGGGACAWGGGTGGGEGERQPSEEDEWRDMWMQALQKLPDDTEICRELKGLAVDLEEVRLLEASLQRQMQTNMQLQADIQRDVKCLFRHLIEQPDIPMPMPHHHHHPPSPGRWQ